MCSNTDGTVAGDHRETSCCVCEVNCAGRWEDEEEMLEKLVSEAEDLSKNWSSYENDCQEVEMLMSKMESELDAVIADTESKHLQTSLEQLQVCVAADNLTDLCVVI